MNTNSNFLICSFTVVLFVSIFTISCKKDNLSSNLTLPDITTIEISNLLQNTASSGGNIIYDGGSFIKKRGVCWSKNIDPEITDSLTNDGEGAGSFTSKITKLESGTKYYLRAYAINSEGVSYGSTMSYTTVSATIKDIDNNEYKTVQIGNQIWMAENLKTTKYRNGDPISNIIADTVWVIQTNGACCNYNNDVNYSQIYGKFYNWYSVKDSRNIAPLGWHIPTNDEWITLISYLGGENVASIKLKEAGTIHWISPNDFANNESGFTALPGGYRDPRGTFCDVGVFGNWWSSSEYSTNSGRNLYIDNISSIIYRSVAGKMCGLSVRCIKDL